MTFPFLLPFKLESDAITAWLGGFQSGDAVATGNEVLKVLKILKKEADNIESSQLQLAVERLTPAVAYTCSYFDRVLDKQPDKQWVAQLNIALLSHLAHLHAYLAKQVTVPTSKNLHCNYALQLFGMVAYQSALGCEPCSASLWTDMAEVYQTAQHSRLLDTPLTKFPRGLQPLDTVNRIAKRNLLFAICNSYRYARADIKAIFDFCTERLDMVKLGSPGAQSAEGFFWHFESGMPPQAMLDLGLTGPGLLFNTDELFWAQGHSQLHWPVADPLPLILGLSNYREGIKSATYVIPQFFVFIAKFEQVLTFLLRHIDQGKVTPSNSPLPEQLSFSKLELSHDDAFKIKPNKEPKIDKISSLDIWGQVNGVDPTKLALQFGVLKISKTDKPVYFSCESIKAPLRLDDFLLLYDKNLVPSLALVRRVEPSKMKNTQKAVIEMLNGISSVVESADPLQPLRAILLDRGGHMELFLPPKKYAPSSTIKLKQGGSMVLQRFMEATAHFVRYQVKLS